MKKFILPLCFVALFNISYGQDEYNLASEDSTVSVDLLRAPMSPAANLLGISNSQIEKPSDPAAFTTTLNNATDNFSTLPSSYAIDIAPFWLFGGKNITLEEYLAPDKGLFKSIGRNLKQSLVVSVATQTHQDSPTEGENLTQFAFGLKASLARGNKIDPNYLKKLTTLSASLKSLVGDLSGAVDTLLLGNSHYQSLKILRDSIMKNTKMSFQERTTLTKPIRDQLAAIEKSTLDAARNEREAEFNALKGIMEGAQLNRYGFKLDLSAGMVLDYPNQEFDNGEVTKAGAWMTTGWDWQNGTSFLGIVRWLMHPDQVFADDTGTTATDDVTTLDAGARFVHNITQSKFEISAEGIYRSASVSTIDPSWRFTVNAAYDFSKNKKLTFVYGRDFDGTITKSGNVIAALNLLIGFGTEKRLL